MADYVSTCLDLVLARIGVLYHCDHRGRLVSVNQWDGGAAPRLFLMRTPDHVVCRFRADLPDDLVTRLEDLLRQEPKPPRHAAGLVPPLSRCFGAQAPVSSVWAGPAFICSQDEVPSNSVVPISEDNAELLRNGFSHWLPDVSHRQPFMAVVENDQAVSSVPAFAFLPLPIAPGRNSTRLSPKRPRRKRSSRLGDCRTCTRRHSFLQHILGEPGVPARCCPSWAIAGWRGFSYYLNAAKGRWKHSRLRSIATSDLILWVMRRPLPAPSAGRRHRTTRQRIRKAEAAPYPIRIG